MTTEFKANIVYSSEENSVSIVGFADNEYNTKEYVLLQRSLNVTARDKELGQDKVHISYKDPKCSSYGGILRVIIKDDSVEILLDESTAQSLKTERTILISLVQNKITSEVRKQMELIFSENPTILEYGTR